MRAVLHHYWSDLEDGLIPRASNVARVLLYSSQDALESSECPLNDWEFVLQNIGRCRAWPRMSRLLKIGPLKFLHFLQEWFPSAKALTMWKVYAALSFIDA